MATINASCIDGFDTMSAEDQVKALLGYEFDDGSEKIKSMEENASKLKAAMDKAASEAAGYKKQLNAKLSDEERAKQENEIAMKAIQDELEALRQEKRISVAKSTFLGNGFDDELSASAADAFVGQDIAKLGEVLKKYNAAMETKLKSSLMGSSPKPDGGTDKDSSDGADTSVAAKLGQMKAEQAKKAANILEKYTRR